MDPAESDSFAGDIGDGVLVFRMIDPAESDSFAGDVGGGVLAFSSDLL